jgi:hypothetical protein
MKAQIAHTQRDVDERNRKLKQEKETVLMNFQTLKKRMNRNRTKNRERLLELTVDSGSCMGLLAERKKRAEAVLQLCTRCRNLETEEEKVLPFYTETVTLDEIAQIKSEVGGPVEEGGDAPAAMAADAVDEGGPMVSTIDGRAITEFHMLDNFWKR